MSLHIWQQVGPAHPHECAECHAVTAAAHPPADGCPGRCEPEAEVLSTEVLTRITEDLWVNPNRITLVRKGVKDINQGTLVPDERTTLLEYDGKHKLVDLPLHEVVALLNGSA